MAQKKAMPTRQDGKEVDWTLALLMSIIFGSLGVDRFIMGHILAGIIKLLTLVVSGMLLIATTVLLVIAAGEFADTSLAAAITGGIAIVFLGINAIWWLVDVSRIAMQKGFSGVRWKI